MNDAGKTLRLGTRGSLLAVAQSRLIANALRAAHPDLQINLVPVETRGDHDQHIPLSDVRDANFFSAELDAALLNHAVDFCVHSLKDLGEMRPDGIYRAAVPAREDPRDVIIFRADVIDRLRQGKPIRIGSSSRRRRTNVETFLSDALPRFDFKPRLEFSPLRGAVDERLLRIRIEPHATDALDGVVLALAGLARLWRDSNGRRTVVPLLANVRRMVLPLSACPAAPGQGALALECRRDDLRTRRLLESLHDEQTASLVRKERDLLAGLPEEHRAAVGATALHQAALGPLMFVRGPGYSGDGVIWNHPPPPRHARAWDGRRTTTQAGYRSLTLPLRLWLHDAGAVFVAHWHAVTDSVTVNKHTRIWVSGVKSWRRLARRGFWVEGCADNLGFEDIAPTLRCEALALPPLADWTVLTHRGAEAGWRMSGVGKVLATYETGASTVSDNVIGLRNEVRAATHFFWGSVGQYQSVRQWLPADAQHACGPGKTARELRKSGVESAQLFPSRREWRSWLP